MQPLLSICIPTYNRSAMVLRLLADLDRPGFLPFPFEVVVCDNASTDPGYDAIARFSSPNFAYRYYRQASNVGVFNNYYAVLRQAAGEFAVYVGDDDRLEPVALARTINAMQADPEIGACFTNREDYDLVDRRALPRSITPDLTIAAADGAALIELLTGAMHLPEYVIYRTDAMARTLFPSGVNYWVFALMERLLRFGSIMTASAAYYRFCVRHEADEELRATAGRALPLAMWNAMSTGLEMLDIRLSRLAGRASALPISASRLNFAELAFMSSVESELYEDAFDLRLALPGRMGPLSPSQLDAVCLLASLRTMAKTAAILPGVGSLLIYKANAALGGQLGAVVSKYADGLGLTVQDYAPADAAEADRHAVLTNAELDRRILIAGGWLPGHVFSLESLGKVFSLPNDRD